MAGEHILDEIGDLHESSQAKLLRVSARRASSNASAENRQCGVAVRVISATNRNLSDLVAQNKFREDLFYRLNVDSSYRRHRPLRRTSGRCALSLAHEYFLSPPVLCAAIIFKVREISDGGVPRFSS